MSKLLTSLQAALLLGLFSGAAPPAQAALNIGPLKSRLAVAGDVACSSPILSPGCAAGGTANLISRLNPNKVFALGDLVYDAGTYANFLSGYHPTWGAFKAKTYPVVGNHEYNDPGAAGYKQYWGAQATPQGTTWYRVDVGGWRIFVLDSNCSKVGGCGTGSPQLLWLQKQLKIAPLCTMAMWHHPRVSSGPHGNNDNMQTIWSTLTQAHTEAIFSGHDHDYERFHNLDSNLSPSVGPLASRQFVVGTGGKTFYPFFAPRPGSQKRIAATAGVLSLGLHSRGYEWKFRNTDSVRLDQGIGLCR